MAAQGRAIRHHDLVAETAVMGDMRIRHQQIVAADARYTLVMGGAAIHRDGFPKDVAIADFEPRRFAFVLLVLRRIAQGGKLKYLVVGADACRAVDDGVRSYPGAGPDDDVRSDHGERPDLHIRRYLRLRRYHRARGDHPAAPVGLGTLVSGATMISAEATSTPSTSADP